MIKIKLADGTLLENLTLNGNNYISKTLIDDSIFEDNLDIVTVYHDNTETVYSDMKLVQNKVYGDESWFILTEKTAEEIEKEHLYQLIADLTEVVMLGGK